MINHAADPLFWQRFLRSAGFYHGSLDRVFGPRSLAAAAQFEAASEQIATEFGMFSSRSEKQIRTLQPDAQKMARRFMSALSIELKAKGRTFHILSGTRTYAEQDKLYAQGRGTNRAGPIVTKARGGRSNHNFGVAWDIGLFQDGKYIPESSVYAEAGKIGKRMGLTWGGDWKSIPDEPHFELTTRDTLTATRARFESGLTV